MPCAVTMKRSYRPISQGEAELGLGVTVDMPIHTALFGILVLAIVAIYFAAWYLSPLPKIWTGSSPRGRQISWIIIVLWTVSRAVIFVSREDPSSLLTDGLSSQNVFQLFTAVLAVIWASYLLVTQRVALFALVAGQRFWISALLMVFVATAAWSIWPAYTLYRSGELLALWVTMVHIITSSNNYLRDTTWVLSWTMAAYWLGGIINSGGAFWGDGVFAALRANVGAMAAGSYILVQMNELLSGRKTRIALWGFGLGSLVVFGSMSSILAMIVALPALWVYRSSKSLPWIRLAAMFVPIGMIGALVILSPVLQEGIFSSLSTVFDKDVRLIMTLTGRLPMWEAIWDISRNNPWGAGFAAADRFLTELVGTNTIGWAATHAHNGYIAAWIGGGWPSLITLLVMLASTWLGTDRLDLPVRALSRALMLFMLVNNLTIAGIGGFANATWLLFMAIALFPVRRDENFTGTQPIPTTRWRRSGI